MMRLAALALAIAALPADAAYLLVFERDRDSQTLNHYEFTDADGTFSFDWQDATKPSFTHLRFLSWDEYEVWDLYFATAENRSLVPGPYENATTWPWQSPTGSGFRVGGGGSMCDTLPGRFDVLQAERAPDGSMRRFAATFEQRCAYPPSDSMHGTIYYDATGPPFPPPSDTDGDGVLDSQDVCVQAADPDQADADSDGIGDACDPSFDINFFDYQSPVGDYIGAGVDKTLTAADGRFSVSTWYDGFEVIFDGGTSDQWWLRFEPPLGLPLVPGTYEAARYPYADFGALDVTTSGRGCSISVSSFEVLEIERAPDGTPTRLSVDFIQSCEGIHPPLIGSLRLNASPEFARMDDADADGIIDFADVCPSIADPGQEDGDLDGIGDACDGDRQAGFVSLDSAGERELFTPETMRIAMNPSGGEVEVFASAKDAIGYDGLQLHFAPPMGQPLAVGSYPNVARYWTNFPTDQPRLLVGYDDCPFYTGRFDILEYGVDASGRLRRFAADFERRCEGSTTTLRGAVRFASRFYVAPNDRDGDGLLDLDDSCPDAPDPMQADADGDGLGDACHGICDADGNEVVDARDITLVSAAAGAMAESPNDSRDADGDGTITAQDASLCTLRCTLPDCTETSLVVPEPRGGALVAIGTLVISALRTASGRRHRGSLSGPAAAASLRPRAATTRRCTSRRGAGGTVRRRRAASRNEAASQSGPIRRVAATSQGEARRHAIQAPIRTPSQTCQLPSVGPPPEARPHAPSNPSQASLSSPAQSPSSPARSSCASRC